ncbi:MAG: FAD-dependent oxidoreductase [Lachnospiraceae bacterium]|nr:FAD-dependent oxidoreductase [Lachnospiraceae bacterium]
MESIWTTTVNIGERSPLKKNISVNTAVIGGGIAGILIAWHLQQRGIETVVLEENRIGGGQTGFTTAKITCQHNLIYDKLMQQFGAENARLYAKANLAAVTEYQKLIEQKQIDCDFSRQPSYLFSTEKVQGVEREAQAARKLGINAGYVTWTGLPFKVKGAVKFEQQAQFHPLKFLEVLAGELTVYEQTRVNSLEGGVSIGGEVKDRDGGKGRRVEKTKLFTNRGTVTAEHVIFACHYPFVNFPGLYFVRLHQERSYVIALENAAMPDGIYLGVDGDKFSLRKAGELTLLGGCSHRTGANKGGGEYGVLREKAEQWFPGSREVMRWSAQDCMSMDGVPYIGRFALTRPNWYVATGFNKWGMTSSMVAAQIIPDLICGTENVYAPVFSPQRFRLQASIKNLLCNTWTSAAGLTKGAVSVLDNDDGITKRCPHLGCKLEWNADENTWECPCHGSCFEREGKKLEGPAQMDLPQGR